jgi:hypothetical protein
MKLTPSGYWDNGIYQDNGKILSISKEKLNNAIIKTYDFKITSGFSPEFKIGYVITIDGQSYDVMHNSKIEELLK